MSSTDRTASDQVLSKRAAQIAQLEEKLRQLKAREQAVEARRRTLESRRSRKADTRRKILVGAVVLAKVERGELARADLMRWLDAALTRADDRELFSL
jgi:cell division protein FtsB